MKTYLVTGAAGFIGSQIAKKLINENNTVITIDNLSTGKKENIPEKCIFIYGNDYDINIINELNKYNIDVIIHIAGQSSGEISFENPIYDLQTNTQSTLMLLQYAQLHNIKNFIFASSMAIYGDHDNPQVCENTILNPKSFYAVGKLASEKYMKIYANMYNIKCTALRFFNVYGIGQNMDNLKQGMASIYLAMALKCKHITVKGSENRFRDFVYIDDVVDAIYKSIFRNNGNKFEEINISTNKKTYVKDIINTIVNALPFNITYEYVEGTPGDQHGIYGENNKAYTILQWKPSINFNDGMKKMINWAYENNSIINR